jgi:hypothetical protein
MTQRTPQLFTDRTPYGIREPAVKPDVLPGKPNWMRSLLKVWKIVNQTPWEKEQAAALQHVEATTYPRMKDDYSTKLFAQTQSGIGSGNPLPLIRPSTDMNYPWPVGNTMGETRAPAKRTYATKPPQATRPIYPAQPQHYGALHSSFDKRRDSLISLSGGRPAFSLDFQAAPWRVPFIRKSGLGLMAGISQHSSQQTYSGIAGCSGGSSGTVLMAPPVWSDRTRGVRGVSGILQRVQGPGRSRTPGVFVPREVR